MPQSNIETIRTQRGRKTSMAPLLSLEERTQLTELTRKQCIPHAFWRRAQAILDVADGDSITTASNHHGISRRHLYKWLRRWQEHGIEGLHDQRRGRPRKVNDSNND